MVSDDWEAKVLPGLLRQLRRAQGLSQRERTPGRLTLRAIGCIERGQRQGLPPRFCIPLLGDCI